MKNSTVRILVIIGSLTIISLASIQFYLLKSALSNRQKVFEHSVQVALFNVVSRLNNSDASQLPQNSPIIKEATNYYIVDVNRDITCETLEFYLISEFKRSNINFDFEYAIYDCYSDHMQYGNYVSFKENTYYSSSTVDFKKNDDLVYYFVVHFPKIKSEIYGSLKIWFVFSFIILCVLVFIIYSIWIILGQKRFSEQQRSFVNTMTHEFRTPLSASNVAIEYLHQSKVIVNNKRLKKYIELIDLQNSRLNKLIERLLSVARSENKKIDLHYQELDLLEICRDIISVHQSKNAIAEFSFQCSEKSIEICSDKFHVRNILHAIVDNAIKYSGTTPKVRICCKRQYKYIILCISDSGIGIAKKYKKKIFQQFYRIPTGNVHNTKGFGVGLYYVKLLSKRMNWKVVIEENDIKGTNFTLKIPTKNKFCK